MATKFVNGKVVKSEEKKVAAKKAVKAVAVKAEKASKVPKAPKELKFSAFNRTVFLVETAEYSNKEIIEMVKKEFPENKRSYIGDAMRTMKKKYPGKYANLIRNNSGELIPKSEYVKEAKIDKKAKIDSVLDALPSEPADAKKPVVKIAIKKAAKSSKK